MNRIRPFFLIAFLVSTITSLNSQNMDLPSDYIRNINTGRNDIPANIKGSPFLNESFTPSQLKINDKLINAEMRYDAYRDAFEVKQMNGNFYLNKDSKMEINYLNKNYHLTEYYNEDGNKKVGYLQSLTDSENLKIYKKDIRVFEEGEEAVNSYTNDKPAKFEEEVKYYISLKSNSPKEILMKKKDIIKFFDDKKVQNFIKEENLKFRDESDLNKLADFYSKM